MFGRVTNYFDDRGFGFIIGDEDHKTYFIHRSKLKGERIEKGYRVFFRPYSNDRSDCNAKDVIVIDTKERVIKHIKR